MKQKINKKFLPQFEKARDLYFIALAMNEINLNIENESKKETLQENEFYFYDHDKKQKIRITDPSRDYKLNKEDFIKYLKIVHKKRIDKGLKLNYNKFDWSIKEPYNLCSDAETRPILRASEDALIQAGINILPEPLYTQFKEIELTYLIKEKILKLILTLKTENEPTTERVLSRLK